VKASFKSISTLLIVILTGILIGILIRYYNTPVRVSNGLIVESSSGNSINANPISPLIVDNSTSGDFASNNEQFQNNNLNTQEISSETIINENGELNSKQEDKKEEKQVDSEDNTSKANDKNGTVIITSDDAMTNKEKREILTELDNTLMELLDVVDKVQTVDETRLITDESEVHE